jgi:hypothetical protein
VPIEQLPNVPSAAALEALMSIQRESAGALESAVTALVGRLPVADAVRALEAALALQRPVRAVDDRDGHARAGLEDGAQLPAAEHRRW